MHIDSLRWAGVPFLLYAGKHLEQRRAYVRIIFRSPSFFPTITDSALAPSELLFNIQGGPLGTSIVASGPAFHCGPRDARSSDAARVFIADDAREPWRAREEGGGAVRGCVLTPRAPPATNAYKRVIHRAFLGDRTVFVGREELHAAWVAWTPLLCALDATACDAEQSQQPAVGAAGSGPPACLRTPGVVQRYSRELPQRAVEHWLSTVRSREPLDPLIAVSDGVQKGEL
jgi:hypothetical protein